MSKGWIVALVVGPLVAIGLAVFFIVRSFNPTPTVPVAMNPPQSVDSPRPSSIAAHEPSRAEQEIARLKAENERLKAGATITNIPSPKFSISGAAWLNRKDGESLLQRGLKVRLLKTSGPSAPMIKIAIDAIPTLKKFITDWEGFIKGADDNIVATKAAIVRGGDAGGSLQQIIADDEKEIPEYKKTIANFEDRITKLQAFVDRHPNEIDAANAYAIADMATVHNRPDIEEFAMAATVRSVAADVDGKFKISDVPQGDYFLYSVVNTTVVFVEWNLICVNY